MQNLLSDLLGYLAGLLPFALGVIALIVLISMVDRHGKRDDRDES